ncbi:MAG: methyltransferase domain-containing protein [Xanthomonadales bacterium]|nr:methyltransferase domain-containing protein [Xanthomonadales bacterium]
MTVEIRFDDGAAYERYMGVWSRSVGAEFLRWLALPDGLRWLDVGCGNGAFTEQLIADAAPAAVAGIDPSEPQLVHARRLPALREVDFRQADAMALPFEADAFDVAVMPLVLFFVPEPARGVAEMTRVICPGGCVSAYAWDMYGQGFPYEILREAVTAMGVEVPAPPSPEASRLEVMSSLWQEAGLVDVQTCVINVERSYASLDEYWQIILGAPSVGARLAALSAADQQRLRQHLKGLLPIDAEGRVHATARAHAVRGRVPGSA